MEKYQLKFEKDYWFINDGKDFTIPVFDNKRRKDKINKIVKLIKNKYAQHGKAYIR